MNMKKAIAGLMAGIVAVSAMATMSVSAAEQKKAEYVFDFMSKGWQVTWTISNTVADAANGLDIAGGEYTIAKDAADEAVNNCDVDALKLEIGGTVKNAYVTKTYDLPGIDKTFKIVEAGEVADEGDIALGEFENITSVKVYGTVKSAETKKEDEATTWADESRTATLTIASEDADLADISSWVLTAKNGKSAKLDDSAKEIKFDADNTGKSIDVVTDTPRLGFTMVNKLSNTKGATIKFYFSTKKSGATVPGLDLDDNSFDHKDTAGSIKDLVIAPAFTVNGTNVWNGKLQAASDITDGVATFKWDEIVAGSTLSLSAIGTSNDIIINAKAALLGETLNLEKIVVEVPAMEVEDITLGAGTEDETPAPVATPADSEEAPADTEATAATEAEGNANTGNAPIALAVIPVALAAAAIVAKKRG